MSFSNPLRYWKQRHLISSAFGVYPLKPVVLNLWEFPTGGEWRSCQVGNDRSDSRTTASKFNTPHPNVDLLYKSQPFTDCFNNKNNQHMRYCKLFTH